MPTLAEYIAGLYTSDGENGLYYHDGDLTNWANDNSYRYSGANPNNYVCFGSDEDACPEDNLYRIIGVFGNQVKLIKYDYACSNLLGTDGTYTSSTTSLGSYYKGSQSTLYFYRWNTENNNTWSSSKLNTGTLKLIKIKDNIDNYIDLVNNKKKDFVDSLYELTKLELGALEEKRMLHAIQFAGFPYYKCLDDFDFSFQPFINKEQIIDFKNLRFIENKENILFVGSPGVGKTHLATAIGIENAKTFKSTYFINCNDLISALKKALIQNRIEDKLKQLAKYKLLIIDEVGYLPIDNEGANLFFQLINKRYEKTPPL